MNGHFLSRLMWGILIIGIGVGLLMQQSGLIHFSIGTLVSIFWPAFLIFLGLNELIKKKASKQGSFFGAMVLILVGVVFLGRNTGMLYISIGGIVRFIVPAVIIIAGLRMIFKPKKQHEAPGPDQEWQAYTSERPTPPPPPLHPDPTKKTWDEVDHFSETFTEVPGHDYKDVHKDTNPYKTRHTHERMHEKMHDQMRDHTDRLHDHAERIRRKVERKAERWSRRAHNSNNRTEWWSYDSKAQTHSNFIGDIHIGQDYWELKPLNISHFIGDTVIDLTKAQIASGETSIHISSFIGDVKVFVPNDYEIGIQIVSSAFLGDVNALDRKEGGLFKNVDVETPYFQETDKRIKLVVSTFIGDVRVTKVG